MRLAIALLLIGASCDDSTVTCVGGSPTAPCCPNADENGSPFGPCPNVGAQCVAQASDEFCVCEEAGWQCHGHGLPDLSYPVIDEL